VQNVFFIDLDPLLFATAAPSREDGFLLFLGGCALDLPRRWGAGLTALAAVAILALSVRSAIRSSDWGNEEKFYKRTLATGGASSRVGVNLAQIYAERGEYVIAEKMLRHIVETTPDYPIARNNLASVLAHEGKAAESEALFARSAEEAKQSKSQYPRTWIAAFNVAHMSIVDRGRRHREVKIWDFHDQFRVQMCQKFVAITTNG